MPGVLTEGEELQVFRLAYARTPESRAVRLSLAALLLRMDHFEEVCELLAQWQMSEPPFVLIEIKAQHVLHTAAGDARMEELCKELLLRVSNAGQRAEILTWFARSRLRAGHFSEARELLQRALAEDANHGQAYRRLYRLDLLEGHADRVAGYAADRIAHGDAGSDTLASLHVAQAQLGEAEQARETQGLAHFLWQGVPAPPEGWANLEAFNQALAAEMTEHASIRYGRSGYSSRKTWHVPQPDLRRSRVFPAFQRMIQREVAAYCRRLALIQHPFAQARPESATLANWCVITEGEGHETWHLHPGWLSGTYYVQVPHHVARGQGPEGCIAFGLPEETASDENRARFGEVLVRPQPGLLVLFPSHVYHRTYPHQGSGRRICCAFDISAKSFG